MSPAAAFNGGHAYRDRVGKATVETVSRFYAARYPHSSRSVWLQRLAAGQICRNGQRLLADGALQPGDRLVWHRPPWQEAAVPDLPVPLFDDGDLLALDKPTGLPVLPAGGYLEHTVLRLLERQVAGGHLDGAAGLPRPVHRLGRFTSGVLVCARRPATRAWLSAQLRDSTEIPARSLCRKLYRALISPRPGSQVLALAPGESLRITIPIGQRPHARLGELWAAGGRHAVTAASTLTLLECRPQGWLVEVAIATGRPHQIRIHTAAIGAPLLGDPLYLPGGGVSDTALPGDGGYHLHARRISLARPSGKTLELAAPVPPPLRRRTDGWDVSP